MLPQSLVLKNKRNLSILISVFSFWSLVFGLLSLVCVPAFARLDKPYDHSTWDHFLKKYVNESGEVDYKGIQKDPSLLEKYEAQLKEIDMFYDFGGWPREEQLALWLNVYHAGVIRLVLDHYPVAKGVQSIEGGWDLKFIKVGEIGLYSLNGIRADQLMGPFRDEKIHMALACGARSCPKLRAEAYWGPRVEGQLFVAVKEFVNDTEENKIVPGEKKIWISRLFKWYAPDFLLDFGHFENDRGLTETQYAVLSFLTHYLNDVKKIHYLEDGNYKIHYNNFDWNLNEWVRTT